MFSSELRVPWVRGSLEVSGPGNHLEQLYGAAGFTGPIKHIEFKALRVSMSPRHKMSGAGAGHRVLWGSSHAQACCGLGVETGDLRASQETDTCQASCQSSQPVNQVWKIIPF